MRLTRPTKPRIACRPDWFLAAFMLCVALFWPADARAAQGVSVQIDPGVVGVGGVFTYTISARVMGNQSIAIQGQPKFDESFHVEFTSNSPGITIRNGRAQRRLARTYRLRATKEGSFTIAAPKIKMGDRLVTPDTVQLKVVTGTPPAQPSKRRSASRGRSNHHSDNSAEPATIEHHISPTPKPYIGQQITLSYALFSDPFENNINPRPPDEPSFDDFWIEDLSEDFAGQRQTIRRAGELVTRTNLRAYALFPLNAGAAHIDAFEMDAVVGGMFQGRDLVRLSSDPVEVEVRPLPPEPPDSFREGNVGQWKFEVTTDRLKAKMGDPITVRVRATGSGQLRRLILPELPEIEGAEVAGKRSKTDSTVTKGVIGGTLTDEYTLVAQREGKIVIPPLKFGYFDPIKERYKTLQSAETPIDIAGGELVLTDQRVEASNTKTPPSEEDNAADLLLNKLDAPRDSIATATDTAFYTHRIFWLLIAVPFLGILGIFLERPVRRIMRAAQPNQGRTSAYKQALAVLTQLSESASDSAILDAIHDAINIYATNVAQIPAGDISSADLPGRLIERGVSEKLAHRLGELLREVRDQRYSPGMQVAHSPQELAKMCDTYLHQLEEARRAKRWKSSAAFLVLTAIFVTAGVGVPAPARADQGTQTPDTPLQAPSSSAAAGKSIERAIDAQKKENWEQASMLWAQALQAQPQSADILFNLGLAHAHQKNFGRARLYLERAAVRAPGDREIAQNLNTIQQIIRLHQVEKARGALALSTRVNTTTDGLFWWTLATHTTPDSLAIIVTLLLWLLLSAQVVRRIFRDDSTLQAMKIASWVIGVCIVGAAGIWVARTQIVSSIEPAVILQNDIEFRDGPSPHAGLIHVDTVVVSGVMAPTSGENDGWVKLDFDEEEPAWTRAENLGYITPK